MNKEKIYIQRKECAARGGSNSMRIVPLPSDAKIAEPLQLLQIKLDLL